MTFNELESNDYRKDEYWYKILLRNLKGLDEKLTKYLVPDFYHYEDTQEKDVIYEIQNINDITNFILNKIKQEKEENEEEYSNYFEGDTEKVFNSRVNQYRAWYRLLDIYERLKEQNDRTRIAIQFNKGYDFGFGNSNYCYLRISYLTREDNCIWHRDIISITTTQGNKFDIHMTDNYYKILYPDYDNVQIINQSIKDRLECEDINTTVEETQKIIDELLAFVDKNK